MLVTCSEAPLPEGTLEDVSYAFQQLAEREDLQEPLITGRIVIEVHRRDGRVERHEQEMRSITAAGVVLLLWPVIPYCSTTSCSGVTSIYVNSAAISSSVSTSLVSPTFSFQVGSGTKSFSPSITSLAAPISNGTGAGELVYSSVSATYGEYYLAVSFSVSNSSSTTVTVSEVGLFYTFAGTTDLITYDTLSTAITLSPGDYATFQITISYSG